MASYILRILKKPLEIFVLRKGLTIKTVVYGTGILLFCMHVFNSHISGIISSPYCTENNQKWHMISDYKSYIFFLKYYLCKNCITEISVNAGLSFIFFTFTFFVSLVALLLSSVSFICVIALFVVFTTCILCIK